MKQILSFCLLCFFSIKTIAQNPAFVNDSLENYIEKGMKAWDVPGLAIVIVKDGKVVLQKGYGVSNIETKTPVDNHTLFFIASNSKLFTGTALAILDHEKKISLNDKFTKYFPTFRLYDSISTELVTIRDLLSHRIGTKTFQGDFTFWNGILSRNDILQKMRLLKPIGQFRQDYGYCNSCFLAAGEVIPAATGISWEQFVTDRLLKPLSMNESFALSNNLATMKNIATPYTTSFTGKLNKVPYDQWDNLGPAASIISNVHDLTNWLMFQLDSGKYENKQVVPFAVLQKTRDVNILTSSRKSSVYPMHFRGYGLGLNVADYNGRQVYWHTGGAGGMVSNVCFIPEEKLGIAILTNNDNQSFFEALRYQLLDAYTGMPYTNRSENALANFKKDTEAELDNIAKLKKRILPNSKPTLSLASYTGQYENEIYGSLQINAEGNKLRLIFNGHKDLKATMRYMDHDEWLLEYDNIEYGIHPIKFDIEANKVKSVSIKANDFVEYDAYKFVKK